MLGQRTKLGQTPFSQSSTPRILDAVLCTSRMKWFGHVEHSTGWIHKLNVVAQKKPKTWDEVLDD